MSIVGIDYVKGAINKNRKFIKFCFVGFASFLVDTGVLVFYSTPLSYRVVDVEEYKKAVILFYKINNIS